MFATAVFEAVRLLAAGAVLVVRPLLEFDLAAVVAVAVVVVVVAAEQERAV